MPDVKQLDTAQVRRLSRFHHETGKNRKSDRISLSKVGKNEMSSSWAGEAGIVNQSGGRGQVASCWTSQGGSERARAKAQAKLAAVTVDVDTANIMSSTADHGAGANFASVLAYQREYLSGRLSLQDGKYAEALQHLDNADQIIRSQPMLLPTQQPQAPAPVYRR